MNRFVLFFGTSLLLTGCWRDAVDLAARTTVLVDQQVAAVIEDHLEICVEESKDWTEYDACADPWKKEAAKVAQLREVTLTLDVAHTRSARKVVACQWFQTVDKLIVKTPAVEAALRSKWRKKC